MIPATTFYHRQADTAMHRAKAAGRSEIRFFLPAMQEKANERLRLNTELRQTLDRREFEIYYQPQVDKSGNIIGAEALLRWNHPERGVTPLVSFSALPKKRDS